MNTPFDDRIIDLGNRFWDDWMRLPAQRHDRACIRPEMSRTAISIEWKKGVSQYVYLSSEFHRLIGWIFRGQHYEKYLKKIIKNTEAVDWKSIDISYLLKVCSIECQCRPFPCPFRIDMIQYFKPVLMLVQSSPYPI